MHTCNPSPGSQRQVDLGAYCQPGGPTQRVPE